MPEIIKSQRLIAISVPSNQKNVIDALAATIDGIKAIVQTPNPTDETATELGRLVSRRHRVARAHRLRLSALETSEAAASGCRDVPLRISGWATRSLC